MEYLKLIESNHNKVSIPVITIIVLIPLFITTLTITVTRMMITLMLMFMLFWLMMSRLRAGAVMQERMTLSLPFSNALKAYWQTGWHSGSAALDHQTACLHPGVDLGKQQDIVLVLNM